MKNATTANCTGQDSGQQGRRPFTCAMARLDSRSRCILRIMTLRSIAAIFFALVANIAGAALAPHCGVNTRDPARRVFAKIDDKNAWREYRSISHVLALDGGISAQLWLGTDGRVFVRIAEPGEDFWAYTEYCFNRSGNLVRVNSERRRAWGWNYRLEGPVESGAIHAATSGFFSTQTDKPIPKPEEADDVSQALIPTLYLETKQLPFSKLLAAPSN